MKSEPNTRLKMTIQLKGDVLDALENAAMEKRREIRAGVLPKRGRGHPLGAATIAAEFIEREIHDGPRVFEIPLLGNIAAGAPIPVPGEGRTKHDGEMLTITREVLQEQEGLFSLTVQGNSMIDAMINEGDIVVLKKQESAENGDMVAVWLRDEKATTLKRLYREKKQIRLQPMNPTMKARFENPENVQVQGKVLLVIRQVRKQA